MKARLVVFRNLNDPLEVGLNRANSTVGRQVQIRARQGSAAEMGLAFSSGLYQKNC